MEHKTLLQAAQKMLERGRKRKWAKVVSLMAAVVVFCTTYVLILPAITASTEPICGMEEHTHGDDCFEIREALPLLRCTAEDLAIHEHTDDCRSDEGELICGMADFLVHSHQDGCYDGNGKLVCDLEEIEEHEHTPDCWIEEETLICALEEDPGHAHNETCYKQIKGELICTSEEYEGHSHGDSCYATVTEQVPKTVETTVEIPCAVTDEGHVCDDSCITTEVTTGIEYEEKTVEKLVCEIPEDPGHAHDDTCYAWTPELTCTLEERPPVHIHEDACYKTKEVLVCGKEEVEVHEHDLDCYGDIQLEDGTVLVFAEAYEAAEAAWTGEGEYVLDPIEWADYRLCGKPEVREHSHEEACFEWPEEGATVEVNLCGKEEHTHDEILCYPTQDVYYCGLPEHSHGDNCPVDENGELICELEEHVHDAACEIDPTDEDLQYVIDLILTLPDIEEGEARTVELEDAEDYEGLEAYWYEVGVQGRVAYEAYMELTDEQKAVLDSDETLMNRLWYLEPYWTRVTLEITDTVTVKQINSYNQSDVTYPAVLAYGGTVGEVLGDGLGFGWWSAVIVEKDEMGLLYVSQIINERSSNAIKGDLKAVSADGFVMLVYATDINAQLGDPVTVSFDYLNTSGYNASGFGTVSFGSPKTDKDNTSKLHIVDAADTDEFIELNLYDYGSTINDPYNLDNKYPVFQQDKGSMTAALSKYGMNFGNNITSDLIAGKADVTNKGGDINQTASAYNGVEYGTANIPISGTMLNTLGSDGYPALADGTSLKYLFTDNSGYATKQNTKWINGLFQRNEESGAYTFNSRENHAQFNASVDTCRSGNYC